MSYIDEIITENGWSEKMESCSWSMGGTYGSCWSDELHQRSSDDPTPLSEFYMFTEILKVFFKEEDLPRKIKKYGGFCELDSRSEGDYYGGHAEDGYWVLDTKDLIQEIVEDNYERLKKEHPNWLI